MCVAAPIREFDGLALALACDLRIAASILEIYREAADRRRFAMKSS